MTAPNSSPSAVEASSKAAAAALCTDGCMPEFIKPDCELTNGEIAKLTRATVRDRDAVDLSIRNITPIDTAGTGDISLLDNSKYLGELATTRAAACLVAPRFASA